MIQVGKHPKSGQNTQRSSMTFVHNLNKVLKLFFLSFQVINEDIWNDLITLAKTLVKAFKAKKNVDEIKGWRKFPWFRQKVRISEKKYSPITPIPEKCLQFQKQFSQNQNNC